MASASQSPERPLRNLRHAVEYHAARLALILVKCLGPTVGCRLGSILAATAFALLRKRRRIAIDNVLRSGVTADKREARRIARESFKHLARVVVESFFTQRLLGDSAMATGIEIDMPPETQALIKESGTGVILVSGHLGNWELAAQVLSRSKPLTGIARAMDNPQVQELLVRSRMRGNFETIDKHMSRPMELIRILRRGRILALLTDQHASAGGLVIPFFGHPAATYPTPAVLHRLTGAPIIVGAPIRLGLLHYRFIVSAPLHYTFSKDRDADIRSITIDLTKRLEQLIRNHPEQYLWAHRRWK